MILSRILELWKYNLKQDFVTKMNNNLRFILVEIINWSSYLNLKNQTINTLYPKSTLWSKTILFLHLLYTSQVYYLNKIYLLYASKIAWNYFVVILHKCLHNKCAKISPSCFACIIQTYHTPFFTYNVCIIQTKHIIVQFWHDTGGEFYVS